MSNFAHKTRSTSIGSIVKDYGNRLFGFIRGRVNSDEDAEDILQDVWYQVSTLVDLDSINSISGWLFRVARNKLTDRYRRQKSVSVNITDDVEESGWLNALASLDDSPESRQFREIFWEELIDALDELPESQRQVFVMNELEDMTLQEIADKTQENLKTIISRKG